MSNQDSTTSTEATVLATLTIGAPYTPDGEVLPLGVLHAQTLADLIHAGSLLGVDYPPEDVEAPDAYVVRLEGDDDLTLLHADGTMSEA